MEKYFRGVLIVDVTHLRVREQKEGLYYYGIRHCDQDFGEPITVEKNVLVNHFGTLITKQELDFKGYDYIELTEEEQDLIINII